jgi:hypothetical protein
MANGRRVGHDWHRILEKNIAGYVYDYVLPEAPDWRVA